MNSEKFTIESYVSPFNYEEGKMKYAIAYNKQGTPYINFTLWDGVKSLGEVDIWSAKRYLRSFNACLLYVPPKIQNFITEYKN